ncbi:TonB-dependent siderophore receptor [Paracoccus caeni]|uniref:TonB-dependent siderophore receptor n=1 Tax=Paracoccus caeni TaxID=657651 RepID=A0A934SG61_9RHOB|nr:TonB-dependent siderophore receptor [Paracoccus caeni]MBK4216820.1 TonB-dependent siderophore receptor [Paracoccus caeni]
MPLDRTDSKGAPSPHAAFRAMLLGCSTLALLIPAAALAQQTASEGEPVILDTITLSGTDDDANSIVASQVSSGSKMTTDIMETAASVSVITSKEIRQRGAQTVEQVLQYSAAVTTDHYGADDRFDFFKIRGFDAHTYRDGLSLGRPFGAAREEAYAFERVEVLKGANSTAFGVSDPGGSVNYITKRPKDLRFGEVYASGGSNNRAEVGFDFGDNLTADKTLSYRLTGLYRDADGEYDYSRDDESFLMGGLTWRPDDATSLTIVADYLDRDAVPGSGGHPVGSDFDQNRFFGEPEYNYRGTTRSTVSAMFDHDFGGGLSFSSTARYSDQDTDFGYVYISGTPTDGSTIAERAYFGNESSAEVFTADARLQYETRFGNFDSRSLLGIEYRDSDATNASFWGPAPGIDWTNPIYTGRPDSVPMIGNNRTEQRTKSIYLQQDLTYDRLIASIGLRNDWIDTTQTNLMAGTSESGDISETTSRLGLTYRITPDLSVYGSYAESVVPASGLTVDPERGDQLEFGVKYRPANGNTLLTAAVYDLTKSDITRTDPVTNLPSTIGEVRVRGIDLEAKAELSSSISLTAGYSYLDSKIVENGTAGNVGNRLSFVPEHTASVWLNYTLAGQGARGDMSFGLGGRYTGSYYFDDANTTESGSNFIVDAAYSYQIQENTSLAINVSNLFDRKHVSYGGFGADFYNPGRSVSATLRRTW